MRRILLSRPMGTLRGRNRKLATNTFTNHILSHHGPNSSICPKVVELIDHPNLIPTVVSWHQKEWPRIGRQSVEQRLCGRASRGNYPQHWWLWWGPCRLFYHLVYYEKGIEEGRPHWIDAVLCRPSHKGQGMHGNSSAQPSGKPASMGIDRLFALTEIPGFYTKSGWERVIGVIGFASRCDYDQEPFPRGRLNVYLLSFVMSSTPTS